MATLIKQWGKETHACNEYIAADDTDLATISAVFGDRVYIISSGAHKIYDGSAWQNYKIPAAYVEGGSAS